MKKLKKVSHIVCGILFAVICVLTFTFLRSFTVYDDTIRSVEWEKEEIIGIDGTPRSFEYDEYGMAPVLGDGEYFRFSGTLVNAGENDELAVDVLWADVTLRIDGDVIYSSSSDPQSAITGQGQLNFTLPEGAAGKPIELDYLPHEGGNHIFPPFVRITSSGPDSASDIAYANVYGIPAGAYGLVFVILCGLILLSFIVRKPDISLILLALSAAGLMVTEISKGFGYYFLEGGTLDIFTRRIFIFLIPAAMLMYLLLNIKRGYIKIIGKITLWSAAALAVVYLISLAGGTYVSRYINESVSALFETGYYDWLIYWLTMYLIFACSAVAVCGTIRSFAEMRSETESLELKNNMIIESYHAAQKNLERTAALRHEFSKHITALDLMYKNGNIEGLGKTLSELCDNRSGFSQTRFTGHFVINCLLQNAAASAAENNIRFDAFVSVPDKLDIAEDDLCVLIMNMLDNAEEACLKLPDKKRYIKFSAELKQGFLAVKCVNPFDGRIPKGLATSKKDRLFHGFGMRQMRAVAEKYGSILEVSYTDDEFTVMTALKL